MTIKSSWRGHPIHIKNEDWVYTQTNKLVSEDIHKECNFCGKGNTVDDHDGCLGTLPNVMNACCGHGVIEDAYVQFPDDSCIRGQEAIDWIKINKGENL